MIAPRVFFVLLLAALLPRLAEAQRVPTAFQSSKWWDEQALKPLPVVEPDAAHRSGGGISDEASRSHFAAESWRPIPALAPSAVPTVGFPLFALEERSSVPNSAKSTAPHSESTARILIPPPPARTGTVHRRAETVYYNVEGLSRMDLAAALRAHGPSIHGRQFFGLTEWEMSAGYRPVEGEFGCAIDDLAIEVSVTTHLPRWSPAGATPSSLRSAWDRFVAALDRHERGHRVLAERAAETVRHRLLAMSAPTCDRLDGRARQEMSVVMQEYERRQLAYDAETGHGRTQGAVWPPVHGPHLSAR